MYELYGLHVSVTDFAVLFCLNQLVSTAVVWTADNKSFFSWAGGMLDHSPKSVDLVLAFMGDDTGTYCKFAKAG